MSLLLHHLTHVTHPRALLQGSSALRAITEARDRAAGMGVGMGGAARVQEDDEEDGDEDEDESTVESPAPDGFLSRL